MQFPDIEVEIPEDSDTGLVRARVQKALTAAGQSDAARRYIEATNGVRDNPTALLAATAEWVSLAGGGSVTSASSAAADASPLAETLGEVPRWQYAVVNVGMFNSPDRMSSILAIAGRNGWELVTVFDKASNWMIGMEKGFMLLKRPVPDGVTPSSWCVTLRG